MWSGLESILNGDKKGEEGDDYYKILGCTEDSSPEQIATEYKLRALKLHPDKNPNNETIESFQKLQEARDVLTEPEKKKMYDQWRQCSMGMTFQQYKNIHSRCQMTMHWATPKLGTMIEGNGGGGNVSRPVTVSSNTPGKGQIGDVTWGHHSDNWESDSRSGLYNKFRNYEI